MEYVGGMAASPRLAPARRAAVLPLLLLTAMLPAAGCLQRMVVDALSPNEGFDDFRVPAPPVYTDDAAWTALPGRADEADAALAASPAAAPGTTRADVFYVHPTSYVGAGWVAPVDDEALNDATDRGSTRIQASAFNACCDVYGPRYRQANGTAFFDPSPDGNRAIELAYADVRAAFHAFLARRDPARPFLLVGHSQGAVLGTRLLVREIAPGPLREKLVAAWLIGAPLTVDTLARDAAGVPVCASPTQTGCVIGYNARSPHYQPGVFEVRDLDSAGGPRVCVNPITWTLDDAAPASRNAGAVFLDAEPPVHIAAFAGASCVDGTLVVTDVHRPPRDFLSGVLDRALGGGNHHAIEYQMFYADLRANAATRVDAWFAAHPAPASAPLPDAPLP